MAGSAYQAAVYHVTSIAAANAIRREGFDLSRRAGGRVGGDGVYATPDPAILERYRLQLGGQGVALELRVDVRRVLSVRLSPTSRRPPLAQVLAQIPGGLARFVDAGLLAPDRAAALTDVVVGLGYDALEIVEDRFSAVVGGHQLVVFDPRRVVVVPDEDAYS